MIHNDSAGPDCTQCFLSYLFIANFSGVFLPQEKLSVAYQCPL